MMPSPGDHLLMLLIAVVYPVYSTFVWFWRSRPSLKAAQPGALVRFYREAMFELWLLTTVVLAWWFWSGRELSAIGFRAPSGWAFWIGVVVVLASAILLGRQVAAVRSSADAQTAVLKQLSDSTSLLVPRDIRERRMAVAAGLTAGLCEEVLFRAFFVWYLMAWLPGWAAVAISAVVFGVGHLYQGLGGVLRAALAGVIFGAAYLFTGSLWAPIALHATVDVTSLLTSSIALEHRRSSQ